MTFPGSCWMTEKICIDFETRAIQPRPHYPPEPVGVAILGGSAGPGGQYLSWGHPERNTTTARAAGAVLAGIWNAALAGQAELVFHNAKFDLAVACERLGLPDLPWTAVHDTMILLFLHDPHSKSLGLKPASETLLGWPPDEQDAVAEWIREHRKQLVAEYGDNIARTRGGASGAGAWISRVPADIVAPYAVGDVRRTRALFERLHPDILRRGMGSAYDRERRCLPIWMQHEHTGLKVDVNRLGVELDAARRDLATAEDWMRRRLCASGLNFDADIDVASVFSKRGIIDDDRWVRTPTGRKSVSKANLCPEMFNDAGLARVFGYRNRLKTCVSTFMEPWLGQALANSGRIFTTWNPVRNPGGGTRTGRPSTSNPNLLNIPKAWEGRGDGYAHPDEVDVCPLPLIRRYVLPDDGDIFIHRDFDGQELRVFAHFEQGELMRAYRDDPDLDPHSMIGRRIAEIRGMTYDNKRDRGLTKILNFQALYGGGVPAAAQSLRCSIGAAREFKMFHDRALPGRKLLVQEIQRCVNRGEPVRTWGGRLYHVEPPKFIRGKRQTFEYKLINYLIQGSAADITKECLARWYESGAASDARFLCTVYDEINISAPFSRRDEHMAYLKAIMEDVALDVPMRSSGKWGPSWGELEGAAI